MSDVTPQKAAQLVLDSLSTSGLAITGIYQNDDQYAVSYGYLGQMPLINVPLGLVNKESGVLSYVPYMGNEEFINSMTPVS